MDGHSVDARVHQFKVATRPRVLSEVVSGTETDISPRRRAISQLAPATG
jgi:hypothetical protein